MKLKGGGGREKGRGREGEREGEGGREGGGGMDNYKRLLTVIFILLRLDSQQNPVAPGNRYIWTPFLHHTLYKIHNQHVDLSSIVQRFHSPTN